MQKKNKTSTDEVTPASVESLNQENTISAQTKLKSIVELSEKHLEEISSFPFSPTAFSALKEKINKYVIELITESIKVSKRYQADTVSANHIERANEYLLTNTSRKFFRHLGTAGGLALGASFSNFLAMASAGQFPPLGTLLSAGIGILGSFLVALHFAKE